MNLLSLFSLYVKRTLDWPGKIHVGEIYVQINVILQINLHFLRTPVKNLDMKEIKLFTKHLSKTLPLRATKRR